ncbi:hypothetical protein [Phreatobacter stygius]|uniref:hypothetical protein n=1 Tax=Phreatobacter stygius TaxID=1940610 RepID=UPI0014777014|nr:hypothetical protein [Phreatobacter stygius]
MRTEYFFAACIGAVVLAFVGWQIGRMRRSEQAAGNALSTSGLPPSMVLTTATVATTIFVGFIRHVLDKAFSAEATAKVGFASVAGLLLVGMAAFIGSIDAVPVAELERSSLSIENATDTIEGVRKTIQKIQVP